MPLTNLAGILALSSPILCMDTCSILDFMRDPTRDEVQTHERFAAVTLLLAVETGTQLVALTAQQVAVELADNELEVWDEAVKVINQLKTTVAKIEAIDGVYGGAVTANLLHLDEHLLRAKQYKDRWVAAARTVSSPVDAAQRSWARSKPIERHHEKTNR